MILILLAGGVILAQFAGTDAEYSRFNANWDGCSEFFHEAKADYLYDYDTLTGKTGTTLLVIAPNEEFGSQELYHYLLNGNTIIIADQSENANLFLAGISSTIRVHNEPLRSVDMEYKDTGLFRGYLTEDQTLFGTEENQLFFNLPGYLTGGKPILQTSFLAWIDSDLNGIPNADELMQEYTLVAQESVGAGNVIVIADPSLFINSMNNRLYTENMAVLSAIMSENLIIDQMHTYTTDGGWMSAILLCMYRWPVLAAVTAGILFLIPAGILIYRRYNKK